MAEGSAGSEVPDNNVIAAATDKTKFWFDDEGDVDVDDLSFREIMNRAKALNARAEEDLKAGRFEKADRHLTTALKYLVDVDEDSPAEAKNLLSCVHALLKTVLNALQDRQTHLPSINPSSPHPAGAHLAHAVQSLLETSRRRSPAGGASLTEAEAEAEAASWAAVTGTLAKESAADAFRKDFARAGGLAALVSLLRVRVARSAAEARSAHAGSSSHRTCATRVVCAALRGVLALAAHPDIVLELCGGAASTKGEDEEEEEGIGWVCNAVSEEGGEEVGGDGGGGEGRERERGGERRDILALRLLALIASGEGLGGREQQHVRAALMKQDFAPQLLRHLEAALGDVNRHSEPALGGAKRQSEPALRAKGHGDPDSAGEGARRSGGVDVERVGWVGVCIRNLGRDVAQRERLGPLIPPLLKALSTLSELARSRPESIPALPMSELSSQHNSEPSRPDGEGEGSEGAREACEWGALGVLEGLVNCCATSMTNKERLATETVQVECAIESSDRWGMKLKSVRPPITVTLVAPASLAHSAGIAQGDVIIGVDGQGHEGPSLAYVQKALREGGPRALTLCRSALSVIARFLAPSFSPHVREAAATALGCVSSFYPPAQLLLIQCGTLPLLLPCLHPPSPPPLLLATADALTNAALNPLNHPTLSSSSLISHAVPLLRHDNEDIRWKAAQLLSLLLSGSLSLSPPPPPALLFLDAGGRDALQACISLSPATTVSGAMGRPGAREYAVSMLAELSVHCH